MKRIAIFGYLTLIFCLIYLAFLVLFALWLKGDIRSLFFPIFPTLFAMVPIVDMFESKKKK